jgi:hypothetical protein
LNYFAGRTSDDQEASEAATERKKEGETTGEEGSANTNVSLILSYQSAGVQ